MFQSLLDFRDGQDMLISQLPRDLLRCLSHFLPLEDVFCLMHTTQELQVIFDDPNFHRVASLDLSPTAGLRYPQWLQFCSFLTDLSIDAYLVPGFAAVLTRLSDNLTYLHLNLWSGVNDFQEVSDSASAELAWPNLRSLSLGPRCRAPHGLDGLIWPPQLTALHAPDHQVSPASVLRFPDTLLHFSANTSQSDAHHLPSSLITYENTGVPSGIRELPSTLKVYSCKEPPVELNIFLNSPPHLHTIAIPTTAQEIVQWTTWPSSLTVIRVDMPYGLFYRFPKEMVLPPGLTRMKWFSAALDLDYPFHEFASRLPRSLTEIRFLYLTGISAIEVADLLPPSLTRWDDLFFDFTQPADRRISQPLVHADLKSLGENMKILPHTIKSLRLKTSNVSNAELTEEAFAAYPRLATLHLHVREHIIAQDPWYFPHTLTDLSLEFSSITSRSYELSWPPLLQKLHLTVRHELRNASQLLNSMPQTLSTLHLSIPKLAASTLDILPKRLTVLTLSTIDDVGLPNILQLSQRLIDLDIQCSSSIGFHALLALPKSITRLQVNDLRSSWLDTQVTQLKNSLPLLSHLTFRATKQKLRELSFDRTVTNN